MVFLVTKLMVVVLAMFGVGFAEVAASSTGASVKVSGEGGAARASATKPTMLQLVGTGFQSIKGGFGGIYVLFGTVHGVWQPSAGGLSGRDYLYVPDEQSKDNAGREKFVAFPGSETADSANGGLISDAGKWSTTLVVPGPTFTVQDAAGKIQQVDCRQVQCGVITIGAHGVVNANNETFTPVSFNATAKPSSTPKTNSTPMLTQAPSSTPLAQPGDVPQSVPPAATASPTGLATAATGSQGEQGSASEQLAVTTIGIDTTTAIVGHALAFTG
ncbi:MAG: hypothetical protein LBG70_01425, partial [Bifidobacteriaceae bacterium]|nr:hypothetical protein [Bifidobacteriaceae bacterium]